MANSPSTPSSSSPPTTSTSEPTPLPHVTSVATTLDTTPSSTKSQEDAVGNRPGTAPGSASGVGATVPVQQQQPVKKACDNCRLRKTKCDLANPCTNCASRGFECTYATPHRKRGPAGRRLNEIREREQQRSKTADSHRLSPSRSSSAVSTASGHGTAGSSTMHDAVADEPHQRHQPQPQQFMFVREHGSLPVGAEQAMSPSWDGLVNSYNATSPSVRGHAEPVPSSGDRAGSTTSAGAYEDALFSLSNISRSTHFGPGPDAAASRPSPTPSSNNNVVTVSASGWPPVITDENLIRWLDIYFERLYPTLPILKRASLFARLLAQEHRNNPDFGAMLLSLSAFALIQPVRVSEQQSSSSSREQMVNLLLMEAVKMRTAVDFGQSPTLDTIFTSVFLFACLFQKQQHNAAWLRLREAVELGAIFGLDRFENYLNCGPEQKQQRLRVYYLLSVTERAYGIQRHHSVGFLGHPSVMTSGLLESIPSVADSIDTSGIVIHDDSEGTCMLGLLQLIRLFDAIDEDFLRCWNGQCKNDYGGCRFLREETAVRIYEQINRHDPLAAAENRSAPGFSNTMMQSSGQPRGSPSPADTTYSSQSGANATSTPGQPSSIPIWLSTAKLTSSQEADILINQQWLQNRLWHLCLSHKLLVPQSDHAALCIYNAITIAENTLRICQKMPLNSIEAHGIGLVEKLYCIVESAIAAIRHRETTGDWWDGSQMDISEDGDTPGRNDEADRYSQHGSERGGVVGGRGETHGHVPAHPRRIECYKPLLLGFSDLFKTIRAGDHMFLERFNALAGHDLGL